jgi:chorismate mutase
VPEVAADELKALRVEIDRIDAGMHALLMERGRIIDTLIGIKTRQGGGSAFRPGREAAMMRGLVERHTGHLPLDTVETIWRVIISTFTYVQSPYSVHVDVSRGEAAMRDSARFHFGFTVPCATHMSTTAVIGAVAGADGDLGMLALDRGTAAGAWWMGLASPDAPKVIARLPFVERPDHPAGMPVLVIAKPLAEGAAARDVVLEAVTLDRWRDSYPHAIAALGGEIVGNAAEGAGLSLLVARPGGLGEGAAAALVKAGAVDARSVEIGAHAARYDGSKLRPRGD